jgi:actin-related protein 2
MLADLEYDGISNMVYNSIMRCDLTLRGHFFKKMLISGGTTMFPGFPTRLKNDV